MLEKEIVDAFAALLTNLEQDNTAFLAASKDTAGVALHAFAVALLAAVPHVSDSALSTADSADKALGEMFKTAGLRGPVITDDLRAKGGFEVIKEYGRAAPSQGYAMLYLDMGSEDSPVFLLRESQARRVVDKPSKALGIAFELPFGYVAKPITRLPAE